MKIYLKGFYGYRNFGDEMILFGLLNFLNKKYNPGEIVIEVGDVKRCQSWINNNLDFLDYGILDKLDFVENSEISKRFRQLQTALGFDKYRNYFKVFGGGEVLDETRKIPHDGRNLPILYHKNISKNEFILVGGIGNDSKKGTKILFKYLINKAQNIFCREKTSFERAYKYGGNSILINDFCHDVLDKCKKDFLCTEKNQKKILINISPKHFSEKNLEKIKEIVGNTSSDCRKIFFPADIGQDKVYYSEIKKFIPNLEIYDWTKHDLKDTINLFKNCNAGIGSRLHFLYPLKYFGKNFESLSDSDKINKNLFDGV